ncbi:MAG TPA: glycosyltransferase [Pseudomonas sp.]|jgi:glycosyltransferase involved in cell wall biosynthesis|nr:glycosyltransferase [Pseudomonas sp.]
MRILFIHKDFPFGGGVEQVQCRLAAQFARDGHEVGFFVMNGDPVPGWPSVSGAGNGLARLSGSSLRLRRLIRRNGFTHLIASKEQANLCAWLASQGTASQVIYSRHTALDSSGQRTGPRLLGWLYSLYLLGDAGRAVAVSKSLADTLARRLLWRHKRLHHCPNAVISDELQTLAQQPLPCPLPDEYWLAVGRLAFAKGFDVLLEAYARASRQASLPKLVIVGDGPLAGSLKALALRLGIASRVHFTGLLSNPYPLFRRARLFVLSSRHEGLPTVLIEALALKVPVVATDCETGPRELLDGGRLGVLVAPDDPQALARGLLQALESAAPCSDETVRRFHGSQAARAYYEVWNR